MKTVYICGDSFAVSDPEYGACWAELLQDRLGNSIQVVNTSSIAASNLLINIQANNAIKNSADFIILLGTASAREIVGVDCTDSDLLNRFDQKELISYSVYRPYRSNLNTEQQNKIKQFHAEFFDLDLAIYRDSCIIENTLSRLTASGIPFRFDQGGFEHPKFGGQTEYFKHYDSVRSAINLWDYSETVNERPYYHIEDPKVHQQVADYYYKCVQQIL